MKRFPNDQIKAEFLDNLFPSGIAKVTRTPSFTPRDEKLLVNIIKGKAYVEENKKTDNVTNVQKFLHGK